MTAEIRTTDFDLGYKTKYQSFEIIKPLRFQTILF